MKKTAIVLTLVLICQFGNSQTSKNSYCRFSVGIFGSTPIYLTGTDKFYNDNWILNDGHNATAQKRRYYKYGYGLSLQYFINKNLSIRGLFGISNRDLKEETYIEHYYGVDQNGLGLGNLGLVYDKYSESFVYTQMSFNGMIGINFSLPIKKFTMNFGFELSYLRTGAGKETYTTWTSSPYTYEFSTTNIPIEPDSDHIETKSKICPGNSYGLGIYLGAEYRIFNHFSVGIEFHEFAFYSIFNTKTTNKMSQYEITFDTFNYNNDVYNKETDSENKENFGQFCFSQILPVLTINYKFNCR